MRRHLNLMILSALALGVAITAPAPARAQAAIRIQGNANLWFVVERNENYQTQSGSGDRGAQETSGFNLKQARLAVAYESEDQKFEGLLRLRLEERTDVIDVWGAYRPVPWFNFYVGQMKIPSTAEVLTPDHLTDFATRSTFGQLVGNYALGDTPYISSLMNMSSYNRDLGLAVKGDLTYLTYFLMVSNGVGGNRFAGGTESSEFLTGNNFGDFYYGARVTVKPLPGIEAGGHWSRNRHDNAILQDKKTVVDFHRETWSTDLTLHLPYGLRLYGFYGEGDMDDFLNSLDYTYQYSGWGAQAIWAIMETGLEVGVRYDIFTSEFQDDGNEVSLEKLTWGMNYQPWPYVRLQANYTEKLTDDDYHEDLDDDIFILNFQFMFDGALPLPPDRT